MPCVEHVVAPYFLQHGGGLGYGVIFHCKFDKIFLRFIVGQIQHIEFEIRNIEPFARNSIDPVKLFSVPPESTDGHAIRRRFPENIFIAPRGIDFIAGNDQAVRQKPIAGFYTV